MNGKNRAWAEVNLDNLAHNIREISRFTGGKKILAVIKADAYGHGALAAAKTFLENGAYGLGVAFIDEALQIRKSGITAPILVLGASSFESIPDLISNDIMPTVFDEKFAKELSNEAQKCKKTVKIHVKIDTGMGRIGFLYGENLGENSRTIRKIINIARLPNIEIDGVFTHFSVADDPTDGYTKRQFNYFLDAIEKLKNLGLEIPIKYCANSAATVSYPETYLDMVRPGIILYGFLPSQNLPNIDKICLKSAMEFKTSVTNVKILPKNSSISYGRKFKTAKQSKIATISVGYADGYLSSLSNKASVLVNRNLAPVVGKICMDQCMIDATDVNNIAVGDEVVLFGKSGGTSIELDDLAGISGSLNYDLVCLIGKRVPRVYIKNGKVVEVLNYLMG
jgi:alanine racemase